MVRHALAAVASAVAIAALVLSLLFYMELRASRGKARRQRAEVAKIRSVLLATANAVVLENRTITLLVREQRAVSRAVFPRASLSAGLPAAAAYASR